jgi:hypothetical protein
MKRTLPPPATKRLLALLLLLAPLAFAATDAGARPPRVQKRAAVRRGFSGSWNWAVYAESADELPPAYRNMKIKEVPSYALDITIRQRGNRLTATCGLLARFLARVDECDFDAVVRDGSALVKLKSNFGGSATVRLTLEGDGLRWKLVRGRGENYYPRDVKLRRLGRGEKLPYAAHEEDEQ